VARDRKKNFKYSKISELLTFLTVIPNQLYVYTVTVVTEHVVILVAIVLMMMAMVIMIMMVEVV